MLLKEIISNFNCNVKVGSGSQFIYCGKSSIKAIKKANDDYYKELLEKIDYYKNYLDNFDERFERQVKSFIKEKKPSKNKLEKYKKKLLDKKEENLHILEKKQIEKEKFTPFLSREVIDIYDSIDEENTKIIIFKGEEKGKYWFTNEIQNLHRNRL